MPYVQRNKQGGIIALTAEPIREDDQLLGLDNPEIMQFLADGSAAGQNRRHAELLIQDLRQIRILEDLIDLLTRKGVILFSELPAAAQKKILNKKSAREKLEHTGGILVQDETLF
ncbi:MAG: hypothetical protein NC112_01695 [Oxalobacter formigenes]|nr:hypothetical protein [Oxalobacter formigenes]